MATIRAPRRASHAETCAVPQPSSTTSSPATSPSTSTSDSGVANSPHTMSVAPPQLEAVGAGELVVDQVPELPVVQQVLGSGHGRHPALLRPRSPPGHRSCMRWPAAPPARQPASRPPAPYPRAMDSTQVIRGLQPLRGVPLAAIVEHFSLEVVTDAGVDMAQRMVTTPDLNRPGLQWAGYSEQFPSSQIQIVGRAEVGYLLTLPEEERWERLAQFARVGVPAAILTNDLPVTEGSVQLAGQVRHPAAAHPAGDDGVRRPADLVPGPGAGAPGGAARRPARRGRRGCPDPGAQRDRQVRDRPRADPARAPPRRRRHGRGASALRPRPGRPGARASCATSWRSRASGSSTCA